MRRDVHDQKRRLILNRAAHLFFERGYKGTPMNVICQDIGVTKPFVYYYFKDKYDILEQLSFDAASYTLAALRVGAKGQPNSAERLKSALRELLRRHVEVFVAGSVYLREEPFFKAETRSRMRKMARTFRRELISLLDEAVKDGVLPPQNTNLTAFAVGGVVGFMYAWYRPNGRLPPNEVVEGLLETLLRTVGLKQQADTKTASVQTNAAQRRA